MPTTVDAAVLPSVCAQATRLLELGVHELADGVADALHAMARRDDEASGTSLLALHPDVVPASVLAPLLRRGDQPGFVVVDMADVDRFTPLDGVAVPDAPVYLVDGLDRGDAMLNWSPDEARPAIAAHGRAPLLLSEGVHWLLQAPEVLERNRCFMTIGSRLRKFDGRLDARTPAIWISGGTGRDGRERRGAPKVGWCWAGNRHSGPAVPAGVARHMRERHFPGWPGPPTRCRNLGFTEQMAVRLVLGALALVLLGGGAVAVLSDNTACERYADTVARAQHLPFAESQRVQADALANCYAEQAGATGK